MSAVNEIVEWALVLTFGTAAGLVLYMFLLLAGHAYDRIKVRFHKLARLLRPAPAVHDCELRCYVDGIFARSGVYREHDQCQGCAEVVARSTPAEIGNVVSVTTHEAFAAEDLNDFHNQTVAAQNNERQGQ